MVVDLARRASGVLFRPGRTFAGLRREGLARAALYLLALLLVDSLIVVVAGILLRPFLIGRYAGEHQWVRWLAILLMVPVTVGFGFCAVLVSGLVLHLAVLIFGGQQGLAQTLKAAIYAGTPATLSLWLLPVMPFAFLWTLALTAVGLRRLQDMPVPRAILAVAMPVLVAVGLSFLAGR